MKKTGPFQKFVSFAGREISYCLWISGAGAAVVLAALAFLGYDRTLEPVLQSAAALGLKAMALGYPAFALFRILRWAIRK